MRKLMQWFDARNNRQKLVKLVERVAERSQVAVWRRVYPTIGQMGFHEARGYIRVRSSAVIKRELRLATASDRFNAEQIALLSEVATSRLVRQTMNELASQQRTASRRAA